MLVFDWSNVAKTHDWPYIIARQQVPQLTSGLISSQYLANLDCRGLGPNRRIKLGRRVGYECQALVLWLNTWTAAPQKNGSSV